MFNVEEITIEKIEDLPDYSIISLFGDTDSYFPVIKTVINHIVSDRDMGGVYVTSTRPARAIINRLRSDKIRLSDVFFIDCISYTVGGGGGETQQIVYVESPTMLESIMLKIEWLMRRTKTESKFVFFDSINTLSIYNEQKILAEFLHILINRLRTQDTFTIILSIGEQTPKEIESMLKLVCDESIDVRREAVGFGRGVGPLPGTGAGPGPGPGPGFVPKRPFMP